VYYGVSGSGGDVAVKVYKTSILVFKGVCMCVCVCMCMCVCVYVCMCV